MEPRYSQTNPQEQLMTSAKIEPGLKGQRQTLVCEHNVAGHVDKFSTPSMIGLMERAAITAVQDCLEEGQISVGFEVNVRHLAPADIGDTITAHAELTGVDRNRLTFTVTAYRGDDTKIGEGSHRRAIITPQP
jgi:predicted thioesterase